MSFKFVSLLFRIDFRFIQYENGALVNKNIPWIEVRKEILFAIDSKIKVSHTIQSNNTDAYWTGFYLNFKFDLSQSCTLQPQNIVSFSTEANIIPEYFPIPDCFGPSCVGPIV